MSCKICFSDTKPYQNPHIPTRYDYCPRCECIALDAAFKVSASQEKHQYDQHNNSLENTGYVQMFENFLDFFWERVSGITPKVLDFGSGPSPVLAQLMQKRGACVHCYDKFYHPDDAFQTHTYDLITSTEVFEHLDSPVQTLTLLTKHLHSGGYIALMTLFHPNKQEDFWAWWYRRDPTHITFFTSKTLEILADLCGLELVETDGKRVALLKKR